MLYIQPLHPPFFRTTFLVPIRVEILVFHLMFWAFPLSNRLSPIPVPIPPSEEPLIHHCKFIIVNSLNFEFRMSNIECRIFSRYRDRTVIPSSTP
jgi:hypothetical protein